MVAVLSEADPYALHAGSGLAEISELSTYATLMWRKG